MNLSILIVIGICAMLTLAMSIIFFVVLYQRRIIAHQIELKTINAQKEQELVQASIISQEKERKRIAEELHDDVNATLSSAKLFLYKGKSQHYEDESIARAKTLLDESILKIRSISHMLQPSMLQYVGLEQSLRVLIDTIGKTGAVTTGYLAINTLPRLDDTVELSVYRITQEVVTNILKHSQATTLSLTTDVADDKISLEFTHDGKGLKQDTYESLVFQKETTGLKNIVSRLKSINATIQYYLSDELLNKTILTLPITKSDNHVHS